MATALLSIIGYIVGLVLAVQGRPVAIQPVWAAWVVGLWFAGPVVSTIFGLVGAAFDTFIEEMRP